MSVTTRENTAGRKDDLGDDSGKASDAPAAVAGQVTAARSPMRCPYCHDACGPEDPRAMVCQQCLSRHHAGCWSEGGGRCASCASTKALQPSTPAIVVSPAELMLLRLGAAREAVERLSRRTSATDADARAALLDAACRELAAQSRSTDSSSVAVVKVLAGMIVAIVAIVMIFG